MVIDDLKVAREFRMQRVTAGRIWRSGIRAIPGTFLVGLVTALCYALRLDLTVTGFLYLNYCGTAIPYRGFLHVAREAVGIRGLGPGLCARSALDRPFQCSV